MPLGDTQYSGIVLFPKSVCNSNRDPRNIQLRIQKYLKVYKAQLKCSRIVSKIIQRKITNRVLPHQISKQNLKAL